MSELLPWSLRSAFEISLRLVGVTELQRRQVIFAGPHGFDLSSWTPPPDKAKAYVGRVHDLGELDTIVVHITAVRGGFGVSARRVRFWQAVLDGSARPPERFPVDLLRALPIGRIEDQARRLALWERYRTVPYHQIAAANGDSLANHDLARYSWHAGLGNYGVGWALDCGAGERLDDWLVSTGQASLGALIHRIDPTYSRTIWVVPHRAFTRGRVRDTGGEVWARVVKPVVLATPNVRIDYQLRMGTGRPVPIDWDPEALYDSKGRPLPAFREAA